MPVRVGSALGLAAAVAFGGMAAGGTGGVKQQGATAAETGAPAGDIAFGEYLAGDCTSCHRSEGAEGIPSIAGRPPEDFVLAMRDFRDGMRESQVMQMMAARLSDDEIAALAAYFETIEPY